MLNETRFLQPAERRIEILAPCAGLDTVDAALRYGADAVYLGVKNFSARRNARNFTYDELTDVMKRCHFLGVKVYLALNTLIFDEELTKLSEVLKLSCSGSLCSNSKSDKTTNSNAKTYNQISSLAPDAVIVQDLGVLAAIKEQYPHLPVHASTQMTVNSVYGAKMAKELGFKRVVLARELSFQEIKEITESVDIETEVFIHGALCVSLSGQCYMSAFFGSRSANRGLCAQSCRLPFCVESQSNDHILSLKDLSIIDKMDELKKIGVTSVKIEGRMKRPEYVAAAVNACYLAREGKPPDMTILKATFSRSGFTSGYFDGTLKDMCGIRQKEDVLAFSNFSADSLAECIREYELDIEISIKSGQPLACDFYYNDLKVSVQGETAQTAEKRALTKQDVINQLSKLSGTNFKVRKINCDIDESLFLPVSVLNAVRREAVQKMTETIIKDVQRNSG